MEQEHEEEEEEYEKKRQIKQELPIPVKAFVFEKDEIIDVPKTPTFERKISLKRVSLDKQNNHTVTGAPRGDRI
jgi:hypothetical protein